MIAEMMPENRMAKAKKLFCREPFRRLEILENGDCHFCCTKWMPRPIGNLKEATLEEVWNSKAAQEIRASVLDGTFAYCDAKECGNLQSATGPVCAVDEVREFDLLEILEDQLVSLALPPSTLALTHDRTCNLSCPTCRTKTLAATASEKQFLNALHPQLLEKLSRIEWLKVTGSGDPFASPYFSKLLESITTRDYPNLKIHLHTNAILLTPERWERIREITGSIRRIEISIDAATSATYAVNRRGGEFSTLLRNLAHIAQLRTKGIIPFLALDFVVQKNNWREMEAFVALGDRFQADLVTFSHLSDWGTFSQSELLDRSVHDPRHPEHALFLAELKKDVFQHQIVDLSNLKYLLNS